MGKTPQLLITACLGYFVAVACSGANLDGGALAGSAGSAGTTGSAGAGLGVEVPDASAAGSAGAATACDCQQRQPVVVTGTCTAGPTMGVVNCVGLFPGKTAIELAQVRALVDVSGCAYPDSCDSVRQQQYTGFATVKYISAASMGFEDGKVTAVYTDGVISATFILP